MEQFSSDIRVHEIKNNRGFKYILVLIANFS